MTTFRGNAPFVYLLLALLCLPASGVLLADGLTQQPAGQPLTANVPVEVVLEPGVALDLVYTAAVAETVSITARSLEEPGTLDSTLEVLSAGTRLAFNDDHEGAHGGLLSRDAAIDGLALPAAGQYVIRLSTFSGAAEGRVEVLVQTGSGTSSTQTGDIVINGDIARQGSFEHSFDASAGQEVTITVQAGANSILDPKVTLYGPSGATLADNDDHGSGDPTLASFDSRIAGLTLPETGTYRVEITAFAQSNGPFTLTIQFASSGTVQPATPVPTPVSSSSNPPQEQVVVGRVEQNGAFTYPLTIQRGDIMTFTVWQTGGGLDPYLRLYDPFDALIAANDDHGSSDTSLEVLDARIENFIFPASGNYTVSVAGFTGTRGDFELRVTSVAQNGPLGSPIQDVRLGTITSRGVYRQTFEAQAGDYVTVTARGLSGDIDPAVTLLDPVGNPLADNDDHGGLARLGTLDAQIENYRIPASGTYTVEVSGFQNTSGTFGLTIGTLR